MSSLRSTTPTTSRETAPRRASIPSIPEGHEDATTRPAVHSLIDFMAAPISKKPSTRKKPDREDPSKTDTSAVWGGEDDTSAGSAIVHETQGPKGLGSSSKESSKATSLQKIMEEEEEEKKEREEYDDSVWFVSRKPRSTSFESIIQQQKREELIAQEERKREADDRMDEELLQAVLEISRIEAEPGQSSKCTRQTKSTNRKSGRPRRDSKPKERAGLVGGVALPKTQRTHARTVRGAVYNGSRAREGGSTNASSSGRSRHSKREEGPRNSSTTSDGTTLKSKNVQTVEDIPRSS